MARPSTSETFAFGLLLLCPIAFLARGMLDWGAAVPYGVTGVTAVALGVFLVRGNVPHAVRVLRRPPYAAAATALVIFFTPMSYGGTGSFAEGRASSGCRINTWQGTAPLPFALIEELRERPRPGPPLWYDAFFGSICV